MWSLTTPDHREQKERGRNRARRMRWNCTRRITRIEGEEVDTWESGTRPFFGPVSFTPGIFRSSIKKPSIFKVKFHRVTSRVYEREPFDRTRASKKTIDCTWFHLPQTFCYYYIPAEMIKIYYSIIPKADIFSYAAIQKFFVSLKYLNFVVIRFLIQNLFFLIII